MRRVDRFLVSANISSNRSKSVGWVAVAAAVAMSCPINAVRPWCRLIAFHHVVEQIERMVRGGTGHRGTEPRVTHAGSRQLAECRSRVRIIPIAQSSGPAVAHREIGIADQFQARIRQFRRGREPRFAHSHRKRRTRASGSRSA